MRQAVRYIEVLLAGLLLVLGVVLYAEISATASPARLSVPGLQETSTAPQQGLAASAGSGSSTISLQVPSFCLSSTATHRTYPLTIPAAGTYARSGEHGHGKLTCIVFMTRTYSKVLVIDQATGGYTIGPLGLDVTYVDCGLPGYSFPPPPFTGKNDCADVGAPSEDNWVTAFGAMFPAATP